MELSDLSKSKKPFTINNSLNGRYTSLNVERPVTIDMEEIDIQTVETNGNGNGDIIQPGSDIKPKVTVADVEKLVERLYGIVVIDIKELRAYDDRNYLIQEDKCVNIFVSVLFFYFLCCVWNLLGLLCTQRDTSFFPVELFSEDTVRDSDYDVFNLNDKFLGVAVLFWYLFVEVFFCLI